QPADRQPVQPGGARRGGGFPIEPARARAADGGAVRLLPRQPARRRAVGAARRRSHRHLTADAALTLPPDRPDLRPLVARTAATGLSRRAARPAATDAADLADRLRLGLQRSVVLQPRLPPPLRGHAARLARRRVIRDVRAPVTRSGSMSLISILPFISTP